MEQQEIVEKPRKHLIEIWKPLEYRKVKKGSYNVSNSGKIKSISHKKVLSDRSVTPEGYQVNSLVCEHKPSNTFKTHRIIARNFLEKKLIHGSFWTVNHEDGDKLNNRVDNFTYMTSQEQSDHAKRMGLIPPKKKKEPTEKKEKKKKKEIPLVIKISH